jgi:hypothetical protein
MIAGRWVAEPSLWRRHLAKRGNSPTTRHNPSRSERRFYKNQISSNLSTPHHYTKTPDYKRISVTWRYTGGVKVKLHSYKNLSVYGCELQAGAALPQKKGLPERDGSTAELEDRSSIIIEGIFNFPTSRPALGPTQPPIQWVLEVLRLGVKRPWREADHLSPASIEVKVPHTTSWRGA